MDEGSSGPPTGAAQHIERGGSVEVWINVYDLLPHGCLSSFLWAFGGGLLHSGLVVNHKEYAYGGHTSKGASGVYWTRPGLVPPGGRFRCRIYQGISQHCREDTERIIHDVSNMFLGPSWNLLTNNCNHFTSYLCQQLTGNPVPLWLNRAASVGITLPCLVPRAIRAPDADTSDGELLHESDYMEVTRTLTNEQAKALVEERRCDTPLNCRFDFAQRYSETALDNCAHGRNWHRTWPARLESVACKDSSPTPICYRPCLSVEASRLQLCRKTWRSRRKNFRPEGDGLGQQQFSKRRRLRSSLQTLREGTMRPQKTKGITRGIGSNAKPSGNATGSRVIR